MKFLEAPVGTKFKFQSDSTNIFTKVSPKSYAYGSTEVKKCKGSGRYYMAKSNPNPDIVEV